MLESRVIRELCRNGSKVLDRRACSHAKHETLPASWRDIQFSPRDVRFTVLSIRLAPLLGDKLNLVLKSNPLVIVRYSM